MITTIKNVFKSKETIQEENIENITDLTSKLDIIVTGLEANKNLLGQQYKIANTKSLTYAAEGNEEKAIEYSDKYNDIKEDYDLVSTVISEYKIIIRELNKIVLNLNLQNTYGKCSKILQLINSATSIKDYTKMITTMKREFNIVKTNETKTKESFTEIFQPNQDAAKKKADSIAKIKLQMQQNILKEVRDLPISNHGLIINNNTNKTPKVPIAVGNNNNTNINNSDIKKEEKEETADEDINIESIQTKYNNLINKKDNDNIIS
jgi:hypothetical protein